MLFQIPLVQSEISRVASNKLEEKIGTKVKIGSVEFELFNKVVLKDLLLEDEAGDTLFSAQRFSAGFEFFPLFRKQLIFSSAQLFTFHLHLNKEDNNSPLNLQFVLDAFASKDTIKKEQSIDLNIHTLNIRRGHFTYHVKSEPETDGKFNAKHLDVKDISAKLRLNALTNDSINAEVSKLSMKDQSGLEITRLLFSIVGSSEQAKIDNFELSLPNSHLQLSNIHARFPEERSPDAYILETFLSFDISSSEIAPKDLKALVPGLANYKDKILLEGHAEGTYDKIAVSEFEVSDGRNLSLLLDVNLLDLSTPELTYLDGYVKRFYISAEGIQRVINNFSAQDVVLPGQLDKLKEIGFNGAISGYFNDLMAYGDFSTEGGVLKVDVNIGKDKKNHLFIKGSLKSPEMNVGLFFPENNPYGKAVFQIELDAKQDHNKKLSGEINAHLESFEVKQHLYKNIRFEGDFTNTSFNGKVNIEDDYGQLSAEGFAQYKGKDSEYDFSAQVSNLKLDKLNLVTKYPDSELSFLIEANVKGAFPNDWFGKLVLRDFDFQLPADGFALDSLSIQASGTREDRLVTVQSEILQATLSGAYSYADLLPSIQRLMHQYLPALVPQSSVVVDEEQYFNLELGLGNTEKLSRIFGLPVTIFQPGTLEASYNYASKLFLLKAFLPRYNVGNVKMEDTHIAFQNSKSKAELDIEGIRYGKFDVKTDFDMHTTVGNNQLENLLSWRNREEALYEGELFATANFKKEDNESPLEVGIRLKPTHLVFNDTVWTVHPARIDIGEKIVVDQLNVEYLDQYIRINGAVSKDTSDNLQIDLNKVNLDYIFNSLTIPSLELGGIATGNVMVNDVYGAQKLSAYLDVKNFSFNNAVLGDLDLKGIWDNDQQGVVMRGEVHKDDTTNVQVDGIILPSKKKLSIFFDAQNANAGFLRKYLDGVAPGFRGEVTGRLHLHGDFKDVTVSGRAMVRNGGFGIDFLNTYYTFNDSIFLEDDQIRVTNLTLRDRDGHVAEANGVVYHNFFDDFRYKANIHMDNFLMFNGTERQNSTFYGAAYGTGNVVLSGTEEDVNIDISMRTNGRTKISLNFMEQADIGEYNFINFVSAKDTVKEKDDARRMAAKDLFEQSGANIKMNLALDATPDAQVEFFVDPVSGDRIKAWGKGKLRIEYGTHIEPKIYGNYTLDRGVYNFSLQQVIFKDFRIQEGSTLIFRGDPYSANLNINALYSLSANLADLDPSFALDKSMNTITVHCLLNIAGEIERPTVRFDLNLPHSTSDLERQVKNIISTDEMMNRQIIFLLALGRFYTQENAVSTSSSNDFANVASSTLSSQLNSLLGDLNENFQIGTNIRTSNYEEYSDTEVKLLLSSQLLNNRLMINGNFGYKDNPLADQRFVGDFDLEYKLTKTGDIRLKAYNHYDDKYRYLKTVAKQGVGVMFRRDFDNLYDLLKLKKKNKAAGPPVAEGALREDEFDFIQFKTKNKTGKN